VLAQSPAECSHKKHGRKQTSRPRQKEFHAMIKKEVQKCVVEAAFQAQFATYCHAKNLHSDDDDEQPLIELPLKLDLEDIKHSLKLD
jgi:hypothetical protein